MRKQLLALFSIPVFVTPYLPDDFADDLAEAAEQFRSFHGIHSAVVGSLRARGRTDEQIIDILEYVMEHPDEFHPGSDGNAAGCLELLNSTNAFFKAESLLVSDNDSIRWQSTSSFRKLAFSNSYSGFDPVLRLESTINSLPAHGPEVRHRIYYALDNELRNAGPERQKKLLRFLLDQAAADPGEGDYLDAILCREVPKWRASQQRAENATKMIREHPDDARLVAFFETVRTNALESARATVPTERRDSTPPPVSTNRVSEAGAPAVQDGAAAASDPWAGLLDDLPEKKPWTPPPGHEPPF